MSDIPNEMYREILIRVPVESLLTFRSVCKTWCGIIDDPNFAKLHVLRQGDGDRLVVRNSDSTGTLLSLSLSALLDHTLPVDARYIEPLFRNDLALMDTLPVPSCHGLILISSDVKHKLWSLWNPFTREFLKLPPFNSFISHLIERGKLCSGLGYDSATNDYKVVMIAEFYESTIKGVYSKLETLIYSLNTNQWKRSRLHDLPDLPDVGSILHDNHHGVFMNGTLHWLSHTHQKGINGLAIIAFDLSSETYSYLSVPIDSHQYRCATYLDALGECLFLSCGYSSGIYDVWIMQNYGVWTKLISLRQQEHFDIRPIAYFKTKGLVLFRHYQSLLLFNVENKHWQTFKINGITDRFCSQVFPAGIVRLNRSGNPCELIDSEGTRRMGANDRCKLYQRAISYQWVASSSTLQVKRW